MYKMINYNPFNKSINDITGSDLIILKTVSEGWYVDYKQMQISLEKLAKHISSFANQYGGWLFIGIKESSEMTAEEFNGIPNDEVAQALVNIREAVSKYVNPNVYFDTKVINGPVKKLKLSRDNSIIIIGIPEGTNPPYIHKSGRIYRRVADQSEPIVETDRFILDQLWKKGKDTEKRLINFINDFPVLSEGEKHSFLYFYFLTNPSFSQVYHPLKFETFKTFMTTSKTDTISASLETTYTTSGGFIGRQVTGNDPFYETLSFRWWHNGNARVIIPINVPVDYNTLNKYEKFSDFYNTCKSLGANSPKIADFNLILLAIVSMVEKFFDLYEYLKMDRQIYLAATIINTWRIIPFIDSEEYVREIGKNGIPIIQDESIYIPNHISKDSLIIMNHRGVGENFQSKDTIIACLPFILNLLKSIGINIDDKNFQEILISLLTLKNKGSN